MQLSQKGPAVVDRDSLHNHLQTVLDVGRFKDYGPNGLQVEGKPAVHKVVSGVTASLALIDAAIAQEADAILVHHGLFWRTTSTCWPTTCLWTPMPSGATTRNGGGASAWSPMPVLASRTWVSSARQAAN